ncbi:3-methyl-2-oxobutanoate dehydrogenase kinase,mitochondrial [Wickerhamomyces ciferrii]|uniref:Protein-serine/threonine kinase n=1 Tax=Wickerhamomyces ciferrii (strain ATCC 14091 / BCRC 22168 / CBS 111 / JCM 3599 / NBRC 0793 / NRRL Y-1031 F-60-10) TaxID=1206466 RepID=K0KLR6_WICCF|nr:3-methyl-2-oxobutanoate dehydrogenase kinase,mitochondrial [Wickerhamomyces ciferrii]CCH43162.1 3-methyl-2-oxobutanoate dehydrogenase kinase,mitochondrial [Wickerhamomyces ciferrii]
MFTRVRPLARSLSIQIPKTTLIKPLSNKAHGTTTGQSQSLSFEQEYNIRSSLEKLITDYSQKKIPKLTLDSLINISKKDISTNAIATINYLTIFNTKRLQAFRELPYLVVLNPHISETYELYLKSLRILLELDPYHNDFNKIHNSLLEYSEIHKNAIPSLSKGFTEVSTFFPKESIVQFLNKHFYDKINMETITNNYINLINKPEDHLGVLNKKIKISDLVKLYAGLVNDMAFIKYYKTVPIQFDFGEDVEFPYIGIHLEYIFTEILKNSIRANIESGNGDKPIKITIVKNSLGAGRYSLGIRFRDDGGGISPEVESNVFDYSFTTVDKHEQDVGMGNNVMPGENVENIAGMGYGLPLTKAYVELFDGNLELQSIYGLGTDVYIELISPDTSLL